MEVEQSISLTTALLIEGKCRVIRTHATVFFFIVFVLVVLEIRGEWTWKN